MVKRIYASGDCKVDISQYKDIVDGYSIVKAKFFTTAINVAVIKDNIEDYTVNLEWDELRPLGKGMLQFVLYYANSDSAFNDGSYDQTDVKTTDFYVVSDITVEDNTATDVDVVMAEEIQENLNEVNSKVANVYTKDETYTKDEVNDLIEGGGGFIPDLYYDKDDINTIVSGINEDFENYYDKDETYSKIEINEMENTLSENIDDLSEMVVVTSETEVAKGDILGTGEIWNKDGTHDETSDYWYAYKYDVSGYKKIRVYNYGAANNSKRSIVTVVDENDNFVESLLPAPTVVGEHYYDVSDIDYIYCSACKVYGIVSELRTDKPIARLNNEIFDESIVTYDNGYRATTRINNQRIIADKSFEYEDGDVIQTIRMYKHENTTSTSSATTKIYVYDESNNLVGQYDTGVAIIDITATTDINVANLGIELKKGYSVAIRNNVNYTDGTTSNRFYDFISNAYVTSYVYSIYFTVLRSESKFMEYDKVIEGLQTTQTIEFTSGVDDETFRGYSASQSRIVGDLSFEYEEGDRLDSIYLWKPSSNISADTNVTLYRYSEYKVLQETYDTGVKMKDLTANTWVDLSSLNIVIGKNETIAVGAYGFRYIEASGQQQQYYYNDNTYGAYLYDFRFKVKRIRSGNEWRVDEIEDKVTELERENIKPIKIIHFGNSFTEDSISYVPRILKNVAPSLNFTIGMATIGGCTLAQHCANFTNEDTILNGTTYTPTRYSYRKFKSDDAKAKWRAVNSPAYADTILADEDWDIITFQQNGTAAFQAWSTYFEPFIYKLHKAIYEKATASNKIYKLGWILTHGSYTEDSTEQLNRWSGTCENALNILNLTGTEILYPYGTAVQNLRTTPLAQATVGGDKTGFLADGAHLHEGIGTLCANYANVLTVLHCAGLDAISIIGEPTRITKEWNTENVTLSPNYGDSDTVKGITEDNVYTAQMAAIQAFKKPFEISDCNKFYTEQE